MKNKTCFLGLPLLLAIVSFGAAQTPSPLTLSISYFGETLSHPGIAIGVSCDLLEAGVYTLALKSQAGWYIHPRNHSAFFLVGGIENRLGRGTGFAFDLTLQSGALYGLPGGTVYERVAMGGIEEAAGPGSLRFMALAGLGFSWRLAVGTGRVVAPYLRLDAFGEYPFNGYFYPHAAVETGVSVGFTPH